MKREKKNEQLSMVEEVYVTVCEEEVSNSFE